MQAYHRVIANTGILYARMAITVVLSLYTTRVTLAALGVGDFGVFNLVGGIIAMLSFLNSGMAAATQRFISYARGAGNQGTLHNVFNVSVVLHSIIALLVLVFLEVAGWILFKDVLSIPPDRKHAAWIVYQAAIASAFFSILAVPYDAVINARENMLLFAAVGLIEAILKLGIALFIAESATDKLIIYGSLTAALGIFLLGLKALYCHFQYNECVLAPFSHFNRPLFKEMASFASWSFLGSSSSLMAHYGQGLVLNVFFGPVANAAQGVANQVSGQLGAFAATMLRALNPLIAKSEGAGNRALMLKASMIGSKVSFFLLVPMFVPVLIEMPFIFKIWLNEPPEFAVLFCRLLLLRNLIDQLFVTLSATISAVGRIRSYQIVSSVLNFLPLIAAYYLFRLGEPPEAIYFAFIAYALASAALTLYFAVTECNLSANLYLNNVIVRSTATFLLALGAAYIPAITMSMGWIRLACVVTFSTLAYLVGVWLIGFSPEERTSIKILCNSLLFKIRRFSFAWPRV